MHDLLGVRIPSKEVGDLRQVSQVKFIHSDSVKKAFKTTHHVALKAFLATSLEFSINHHWD